MGLPFYMGGSQNYAFLSGPLNTSCRIILGTKKGTLILTTTHMSIVRLSSAGLRQGRSAEVDPGYHGHASGSVPFELQSISEPY